VGTSLLLWPLATSWVYGAVAVGAGAWFLVAAHGLLARVKRGAPTRPLPLFHLSNSYLAILFVGVAVDALVR
jgi:protoheme IX farnesyltransferase